MTAEHQGRIALPAPGVLVPLATPLGHDGRPDLESLVSLIGFALGGGVDGVLVLGSSGEGSSLTDTERHDVARCAITAARGRTHVMVGVPPAGSSEMIRRAEAMDALGPDSLLVTAPIGLAPSSGEIAAHFAAVSSAVEAPVVAYEVPSRVGVSLSAGLLRDLALGSVISGVKDSSGNLVNGRLIALATKDLAGFVRYTGTEHCIDAEMLAGYDGSIPGIGNVFPDISAELGRRAAAGDWRGAAAVQDAIVGLLGLYAYPLPGASVSATFLAVVKESLVQLGVIATATATAPFTAGDDGLRTHVRSVLAAGDEVRKRLGIGA